MRPELPAGACLAGSASLLRGANMPEPRRDYFSKEGAESLGRSICAYWRSCGFEVDFRVEFLAAPRPGIWVVRTDLKGGLPPPVR